MFVRWLFAALHLLALGVGLGAIWGRRLALLGTLDETGLRRLFHEDNWWAVAAALWIGTGLVRAFGGLALAREPRMLHQTPLLRCAALSS